MDIIAVLIIAVILDLSLGDPPNSLHPVAWMGRVASFLEKGNISRSLAVLFVYGMLMVLFTMGLFTVPVYILLRYLEGFNNIVFIIIGAVLLKTMFSLGGLRRAALVIRNLLRDENLDEARFEMRALVSRDASCLSETQLVAATVESVEENISDGFVAPLFYFLLFGVPGAVAYRVVNTHDAMIGYHGRYEYLGKFACRLDDVLNYIPARLTALLIVAAAFIYRRNGKSAWKVALTEHRKTESPNAGWPMAAMAGALDAQLGKEGEYRLGVMSESLVTGTIDSSLKLALAASMGWVIICCIAGGISFALTA